MIFVIKNLILSTYFYLKSKGEKCSCIREENQWWADWRSYHAGKWFLLNSLQYNFLQIGNFSWRSESQTQNFKTKVKFPYLIHKLCLPIIIHSKSLPFMELLALSFLLRVLKSIYFQIKINNLILTVSLFSFPISSFIADLL